MNVPHSCLTQRHVRQTCLTARLFLRQDFPAPARRSFHPSQPSRSDDNAIPNHYATLDLPTTATPAEIKKQFYRLSKAHHPDLHPNDSTAAARFVNISEAHAVLGSPEKKARYDRDFLRASHASSASATGAAYPSGSFSSHAGSRPASGLSRRRTAFRGPPPSFYRSGGWGEHGEKRSEAARQASHTREAQGQAASNASASSSASAAGTGPGGFTTGFDDDVRHFDQRGHFRTHHEIERTRHRARRKGFVHGTRGVRGSELQMEDDASGTIVGFVVICGVFATIFGVSWGLMGLGGGAVANAAKQKSEDGR